MLRRIVSKLSSEGLVWCIKRTLRELWHPQIPILQNNITVSRAIYWPFAKFGEQLDKINSKSKMLRVFYDLDISPITFDFCWTVAVANYKCEMLNTTAHFIIVPGSKTGVRAEDEDYEKIVNGEARKWRISNVLLPLTTMAPRIKGFTYCSDREEAKRYSVDSQERQPNLYSVNLPTTNTFFQELKSGIDLRCFTAQPHALKFVAKWIYDHIGDKKLITVTMRDYDYLPARNTDIPEWNKFLSDLDRDKYAVVIIPDITKAWTEYNYPFEKVFHFIPAAWNVDIRMAIYQSAYLNLGPNSGPMCLCWLSKNCKYITFKHKTKDVASTSDEFHKWLGFTPGESLPFASDFQKWVWEADTADVLTYEFYQMIDKIECQKNQ